MLHYEYDPCPYKSICVRDPINNYIDQTRLLSQVVYVLKQLYIASIMTYILH